MASLKIGFDPSDITAQIIANLGAIDSNDLDIATNATAASAAHAAANAAHAAANAAQSTANGKKPLTSLVLKWTGSQTAQFTGIRTSWGNGDYVAKIGTGYVPFTILNNAEMGYTPTTRIFYGISSDIVNYLNVNASSGAIRGYKYDISANSNTYDTLTRIWKYE